MNPWSRTVASAAGRVLQLAVTALALLRPAAKPMHPLGGVFTGRLHRPGAAGERTGSPFLDGAGDDEVLVRVSRSVGLHPPLPDVNGLAVRVPADGRSGADGRSSSRRPGDLLLSTTGRGRLSRYALLAHRSPRSGTFTSLVPFRTTTGPVHVGARAATADRFELFWARPTGDWHRFGEIVLAPGPGTDRDVSFDAILNPLDGLDNYEWYRRLRAPAYAAARRLRGSPSSCRSAAP